MPSKVGYLQRYLFIIQRVRRKKFISMDELIDAVKTRIAFGDSVGVSKSTIRRDLKEIRDKFYIQINYSKADNGYYISDDEGLSDIEMMLEPLNLLSVLHLDKKLPDFVLTEKRKSRGMEHLPSLIHAIKNSLVTEFFYIKYDSSPQRTRRVAPYALKEFKGRWYLLAAEIEGRPEEQESIKTWGLDRIQDLYVTGSHFWKKYGHNVGEKFAHSFGIFSDEDKEVEEVILSFTPQGGKYNESFPLHESQEILIDNDCEFRIRLKVKITYDFIMELLSQCQSMKVIAPVHLRNKLIEIYKDAIKSLESLR